MGRRRTRPAGGTLRGFAALRGLPREGIEYLHGVFGQKQQGIGITWESVLAELQSRWGFAWNDSSLSRYYGFWEARIRVESQAHEEAIALAEHFLGKSDGSDASDRSDIRIMLQQLLEHQRLIALSNLGGADPVEVAGLAIAQDRTDLAREKLQIGKGKLALDTEKKKLSEEKLAIDQARLVLDQEKKLAIDRPALFLDFFKTLIDTLVQTDPQAAEILNRNFDRVMVKIKGAAA